MKRVIFFFFIFLFFFPCISFSTSNSSRWRNAKSLDSALYAHSAVSGNDRIYVIGGFSLRTRQSSSALKVYHPLTENWTRLSSMKHKRGFSGAVFLNGKIYVIGGNDGQRTLNYTEIYDTATDTWSYGQPMPTPRRGFAIAQLNGKIYCFGGYNLETRTTLTNAEVYDTVLNKWEKLPNMPFPRQGATAVTYNNRIYVLGGVMGTANSGNGPIFLRDMNYYLVKERQWENGPSLVFDRYYLTSVIHNNIIYAIGGIKGLRPLNIVETINIENGSTWVSKDELNLQSPRNASVAVYLNGVIYAIGGLGNEGELNTVESLRIE